MKRQTLKTCLLAAIALPAITACDMMKEDLDDCPTGLYVNFVYDYNIQRADMFKDHVGAVTLYVYDENDRMVAQKTQGDGYFTTYGRYIHFTEDELAPGHTYRLVALAMQKDFADAYATQGAKYRISGNAIGDQRQQLHVTLDNAAATARLGAPSVATPSQPALAPALAPAIPAHYRTVSNVAPLDTLWHTLTTIQQPATLFPVQLYPAAINPAKTEYSWQRDGSIQTNGQQTVTIEQGVPAYATMSLIRDTKQLHVSLRAVNDDPALNQVKAEDYYLQIVDCNAQVDCNNDLSATTDTLVYTPYFSTTTTYVAADGTTTETAAQYDLMFNRLLYRNADVNADRYAILDPADVAGAKNALLLVKKTEDDSIVFGINLPYILSSGRSYQERYYHYQEYLDREYDYRLQFILKGGKVEDIQMFIGMEVHIIPWAVRTQHEVLE